MTHQLLSLFPNAPLSPPDKSLLPKVFQQKNIKPACFCPQNSVLVLLPERMPLLESSWSRGCCFAAQENGHKKQTHTPNKCMRKRQKTFFQVHQWGRRGGNKSSRYCTREYARGLKTNSSWTHISPLCAFSSDKHERPKAARCWLKCCLCELLGCISTQSEMMPSAFSTSKEMWCVHKLLVNCPSGKMRACQMHQV